MNKLLRASTFKTFARASVPEYSEDLASKEYDLDKAFNDIFSKDSKAIDEIVKF